MFNAAVGKKQLLYMLSSSTKNEHKVIIIYCHLPLHPEAASPEALLWNYEEVLDAVKACFAGQDHKGGYKINSHVIHHRVFEASLECSNAYGYIDVYHDELCLLGTDRMMSTELVFS